MSHTGQTTQSSAIPPPAPHIRVRDMTVSYEIGRAHV